MALSPDQEEEVRKKVIDRFGEDAVKKMDTHFMELNDIRIVSKDSYEFLVKVKEKYPDNSELLLAAILYGMRQGELGYEYHLKQKTIQTLTTLPKWGDAS